MKMEDSFASDIGADPQLDEAAPASPAEANALPLLPDLVLDEIISFADLRGVASWRLTSKETCEIANSDRRWRERLAAQYPLDAAYVSSPAFGALPSARQRYATWHAVQRRWRGESGGVGFIRSPILNAPLFCINHAGDGLFLCAGASSTVHVVRRRGTALLAMGADSGGSSWGGAKVNSEALETIGEWEGGSPVLGFSVDAEAGTAVGGGFDGTVSAWAINVRDFANLEQLPAKRLRAILAAKGIPTSDIHEKVEFADRIRRYRALPLAVPLKPLASGPGGHQHGGTVVSVAHKGKIAVSGSNDCTTKLWDLDSGACLHTLNAEAGVDAVCLELRTNSVLSGCKDGELYVFDIETGTLVHKHPVAHSAWIWAVRTGSTWTEEPPRAVTSTAERSLRSAKGGGSSVLLPQRSRDDDTSAAGGSNGGGDGDGDKNGNSYTDSGDSDDDGYGYGQRPPVSSLPYDCVWDGRLILTGTTSGSLVVVDSRMHRTALRRDYEHYTTPRFRADLLAHRRASADLNDDAGPWEQGGASGYPIAGIAPMFGHNRFVTSSFDGFVRVFDLRTMRPLLAMNGGGARLSRCEVYHDLIVCGSMDGCERVFDFRPNRGGD